MNISHFLRLESNINIIKHETTYFKNKTQNSGAPGYLRGALDMPCFYVWPPGKGAERHHLALIGAPYRGFDLRKRGGIPKWLVGIVAPQPAAALAACVRQAGPHGQRRAERSGRKHPARHRPQPLCLDGGQQCYHPHELLSAQRLPLHGLPHGVAQRQERQKLWRIRPEGHQ